MKNIFPLVLAVLLGLAAVYAIKKTLAAKDAQAGGGDVEVVAAAQNLPLNARISENNMIIKKIPKNAMPAKAIPWTMHGMLRGMNTYRMIPQGDYIQWSDVGSATGLSELLGDGEWAVSIPFADNVISSVFRPGDEIAIIGTFTAPVVDVTGSSSIEVGAPEKAVSKQMTAVIFPRVRIVSIPGGMGSTIILSLKPEQAQFLIDAQRKMTLYPVLRKPNDDTNLDRIKTGMVTQTTYDKLFAGQHEIVIPANPELNKR